MKQFRITLLVDIVDLSDEKLVAMNIDRCNIEGWQKVAGVVPGHLGIGIAEAIKSQLGNDLIFEGSDYYVEISDAKCECVEIFE